MKDLSLIANETKVRTDTHSADSDFRAFAGGIDDRKIIDVYRKRHERPVVYLALVRLAGRQSPRIAAQFEHVIQRIGSGVSASLIRLFHLDFVRFVFRLISFIYLLISLRSS